MRAGLLSWFFVLAAAGATGTPAVADPDLSSRELVTYEVNMTFKTYNSTIKLKIPRDTKDGPSRGAFMELTEPGLPNRHVIRIMEDNGETDSALFQVQPLFLSPDQVADWVRNHVSVIYVNRQSGERHLIRGRRRDREYEQVDLIAKTPECSNCYVLLMAMVRHDDTTAFWESYFSSLMDQGFPTEDDFSFSKMLSERAAVPAPPAAPPARTGWVALAAGIHETVFQNRVAVGVSEVKTSRDEAEADAVSECRVRGFSECHAITAFNSGCGYITTGSNGSQVGYGSGITPDAAINSCAARGLSCETPVGRCAN